MDYVLVSAPLLLVSMTVISIVFSTFATMVLRDSAIEGARFAALADQGSDDGCVRVREVSPDFVNKISELDVSCYSDDTHEIVEINASLPLFGLISGGRELRVLARAIREN